MRDVATGAGVGTNAALATAGPSGPVIATDLSSAMLEKVRMHVGAAPNVAQSVEDCRSLTFPDQQLDAVHCAMGLVALSDPARGLSSWHRVIFHLAIQAIALTFRFRRIR